MECKCSQIWNCGQEIWCDWVSLDFSNCIINYLAFALFSLLNSVIMVFTGLELHCQGHQQKFSNAEF